MADDPDLMMFPVLVVVYRRLARNEEREVAAAFGSTWVDYAAAVHPFRPKRPQNSALKISRPPSTSATHTQ